MTPAAGFETGGAGSGAPAAAGARARRAAVRRPATALALGLQPSAATSTLAGRSSDTYQATERYRERFGDHAIVVLVRGPLAAARADREPRPAARARGLPVGQPARGLGRAPGGERGPCAELARTKPVQVVYGPGTFINSAVGEIQDQLKRAARREGRRGRAGGGAPRAGSRAARASRRRSRSGSRASAEQLVYAQFVRDLLALNLKYGLGVDKTPRLDDPDFVATLVFDPKRGATTPKARFAYLFPSSESAAIQVRLKPGLSDAERERATELVRAAVRMPDFRLRNAAGLHGHRRAGAGRGPLGRARRLGRAAAARRARRDGGVLALVFRRRLRLVPLAVALGAVALTFGLMALVGAPLTMASIAVLPVLLGLGGRLRDPVPGADPGSADGGAAPLRAARVAVPTIATAALATAAGFLVLLLSPVPMVRGFGVLLVLGVGIAFALALTGGTAALVALGERRGAGGAGGARSARRARVARRAAELLGVAARGRRALGPAARGAPARPRRCCAAALARPRRVLAVALALAAVGWVVDTQTEVRSDLQALVPQDLPAVRDLETLQRTTGVAGEVDVVVEGRDLTDPKVVAWMSVVPGAGARRRRATRPRTAAARPRCARRCRCPTCSRAATPPPTASASRALLDAVPPYFSQAVITRRPAHREHRVRHPPDAARRAARRDRADARGARPAGGRDRARRRAAGARGRGERRARVAVAAARHAARGPAGGRRSCCSLVHRRAERAWVPLVPIALATGWSALVLFALRIPLNPMSATLGALVIALSTEFAVLLDGRYREERAGGPRRRRGAAARPTARRARPCSRRARRRSRASRCSSFSDVRMLQEFGIVTVVDLSVSLLGVLAVLPAVLVLAERRAARRRRAPRARRVADPAVPA